MSMFKKLSTSLVVSLALLSSQVVVTDVAQAATAKKEKKKSQAVGTTTGKLLQKAYEAYEKEQYQQAVDILKESRAKDKFDIASVDNLMAFFYATMGNNDDKAMAKAKAAYEANILNERDHHGILKLLADLEMGAEKYQDAIKHYLEWSELTGKSDPAVWTRVASAYFADKQFAKVVPYADKAIVAYGDKHNKNPYVLKLQSYYERKMNKEAVKVLETAVQIFPQEKSFWLQLGNFYLLVEDFWNSMATFELAYKLGFVEKATHIKTLASLYAQNGIPFKAAMLTEKYMKSGVLKRDKSALMRLANNWHSAMHIDKAANYYGEIAKLTKDHNYYKKQGMLLKQDEQFKNALVAFDKALELGSEDRGRIFMSIAESHFYLGQYKKAYSAILKAAADPKTKKSAKGWVGFIKETARRKGVTVG